MSSTDPAEVLVVEDDQTVAAFLGGVLGSRGWNVTRVGSAEEGLRAIRGGEFDVVLLDLFLPGMSGLEMLGQLSKDGLPAKVVVMTGDPSIDSAVEAMRHGAFDYVEKPLRAKRIQHVIEQAVERHRLELENRLLRRAIDYQRHHGPIIHASHAMQDLLRVVERVAPTDAPVLISGETGVGKGLFAKRIHTASERSEQAFVHVNCGGLQEQLVESELFGHERGAFTGAVATKPGLFEVANRGTLFLDEIAELTPGMQANLLQVLDSGELRRVGGSTLRRIDSRVLAATNRDIAVEVESGNFREDLFFRLNVVRIEIPPLRERSEDIRGLVEHYVRRYGGDERSCSEDLLKLLEGYDWPGNVRELSNVIQRATLLSSRKELRPEDVPLPSGRERARSRRSSPVSLKEVERDAIRETLEYTEGNRSAAARILKIDVKTLRSKIRAYGLGD